MITSSSKYDMTYFNIPQLENKLNKKGLSVSLWQLTKKKLTMELSDAIPGVKNRQLSFLKDISDEKDNDGNTLFRGLFVVCCEKILTESEMQILLTQYLKDNPNIDRSIPKNDETTSHSLNIDYSKSLNTPKSIEDLNVIADNLDENNLIFGVIDDLNHLPQISQIEGIEILESIGSFKKTYFSIPSFRQDEVLAHSVTILKSIKCKRALIDFIN